MSEEDYKKSADIAIKGCLCNIARTNQRSKRRNKSL